VAYYPFNGNFHDESGNGNVLKSRGGASVLDGRLQLDGIDDTLESENPVIPPNHEFSISMRFRHEGDQFGQWIELASQGNTFYLGRSYDNRTIRVGDLWIAAAELWPTDGRWHWITVSSTETGTLLALDGVVVGKTTVKTYAQQSVFRIGSQYAGHLEYFSGSIDDVRIYNRALSDAEVKALYDYESTPQPLSPRIASATAQVVNGFVVGATITDAGYGYVSNPAVTITGGGGSGAKATATQFNGVVTSITITNPGSGYNSAPTITIAPPPFPPRKATGTTQIVNGFVVGTKITDGGFGYDTPPAVLIVGGGGSGATAVATVANGVVTAITITNPGTGYTSIPIVRIASPPFAPKLAIETSKVYVRMSVVLGRKYQLEASTDLNTWTSTGPSFIAQDEELVQEFDVNQVGRYFRINQVP